ncbi:MAG: HYR domain-containing protein [Saprospiraceae bacterium]
MNRNFILLSLLFLCCANGAEATTYYLKNNNPTQNWNDACNWYTNPDDISGSDCGGIPGIGDNVIITGHSFINISGSVTIAELFRGGYGTIGGTGTFTVTGTATLQGAGVDVDGKVYFNILHLNSGTVSGADTAFVSGAVYFNAAGVAGKTLVLNCPGYWNQNNIGVSFGGKLVLAAGQTLHLSNDGENVSMYHSSGGYFYNFGTFTKNSSKNLTLGASNYCTGGTFNFTGGTVAITNNMTLTNAQINVSNNTYLDFQNGARIWTNSDLASTGTVRMKGVNDFAADCSATFDTLIIYGSGGAEFNIPLSIPHLVMTGGAAFFFEDCTVTASFWWLGGHIYGDAVFDVQPLAHLACGGTSYTSCKFDFWGGAEWTSGGFELNGGAEFNFPNGADFLIDRNTNGTIGVGSGTPYGEINLTPGSILTKNGTGLAKLELVVNSDQSQFFVNQGGLDLWRGTHDDSHFQIAPSIVLHCYNLGNNFYRSEITGSGIFRSSGSTKLDSLTTLDCHLEVTGGQLTVNTPITPIDLKLSAGEINGTGHIEVVGGFVWNGFSHLKGTGEIDIQGFTTMSGTGGRLMYKKIHLHGGGSWDGSFDMAFSSTGQLHIPPGANLTVTPTANLENTGSANANVGIRVEGSLVKNTTYELRHSIVYLTNLGSIEGIGTIRTWNYNYIHPNEGLLSPGSSTDSIGSLAWSGHFENKPAGNLLFSFRNNGGQIEGDAMQFLHNLTLGGTLTVHADPCWPSFEKTILTWAGTKTGSFAALNLPPDYSIVVDDAAKTIKLVHTYLASAVTCPANVSVNAAPGSCSATPALGLPTAANSNCSGSFSFSNDAPANFPVGSTTVTWTATDPQGNTATCQQIVTVADVELPTISCPMMLTVNTDAGQCTSTQFVPTASASDNCTLASLTNDAPASLAVGSYLVNYTATDASGNSALCAQGIVVQDVELPTITCPTDILVDGCGTPNIMIDPATATDNCGISSISNDAPASFPIGTTIVTHTATDVHGNAASCQQTVNFTGADVENPLITTCPTDKTKLAEPGLCGASVNFSPAAATDNCGQPALYFSQNSGSFFAIGTTIVTLTATDGAGNTAVCAFTITVNPRQENTTNGLDDDCDGLVDEPMKLTFARTNVSCHDAADGAIDLTVLQGLPPYMFAWSNGAASEDLTGLSGGEYTVTVEDAQGLVLEKTIVVAEPPAIKINFDATNPLCFNTLSGTLTANPSRGVEPYFYQWSSGASNQTLTGLPSGTFSVVVTDANGCTASSAETLTEPAPLLISGMSVTANPCFGDAKGKASPVINPATNGTGQLTYLWSNGAATKLNTNLPAGTYTVTVTDANGCSKTAAAALVDPAQLTLDHTLSGPDANGKYTVTLAAAGGTPFAAPDPYRYCKFNPATGACGFSKTKVFANLLAGQAYTFRAKDSKGCQTEISVTMPAPRPANSRVGDDSLEPPTAQAFSLSPNPCRDFLRLRREADSEGEFRAQIFDANGRLMADKTWANDLQQIDFQTTEWPSGVFWVRLQASDGTTSVRRAVKTD